MGGRHIHHLVWGILILLLVGYGWLMDVGSGTGSSSILMSRTMSVLYGAEQLLPWMNSHSGLICATSIGPGRSREH